MLQQPQNCVLVISMFICNDGNMAVLMLAKMISSGVIIQDQCDVICSD